jgi:hypothetical protein
MCTIGACKQAYALDIAHGCVKASPCPSCSFGLEVDDAPARCLAVAKSDVDVVFAFGGCGHLSL